MVTTIVLRIVAALAGFQRIQAFLLRSSLRDSREVLQKKASGRLTGPGPASQTQQLSFILEDIEIKIPVGSLTIISGPMRSGNSTLLRTIIGEVVPVHGSINLATRRITHFSQRSWLPNGTIQDTICGCPDRYSEILYHEMTKVCCLEQDFNAWGWDIDRQRVMRFSNPKCEDSIDKSPKHSQERYVQDAIYFLLDDLFSGLDDETEQNYYRKSLQGHGFHSTAEEYRYPPFLTVLSLLVHHLLLKPEAYAGGQLSTCSPCDHIVVLGDRRILDQITWQNRTIKATLF
ncbi:hypothetical protein GGR50DRAFT_693990 [Xylaria sp. CBS 124048]|nr:hypothetical protein GGR50DRAFT_693990 [Xylaria sp. CBS 124048]